MTISIKTHRCAICHEQMTPTFPGSKASNATYLDCMHRFHRVCLKRWRKKEGNSCPTCQRPLCEMNHDNFRQLSTRSGSTPSINATEKTAHKTNSFAVTKKLSN